MGEGKIQIDVSRVIPIFADEAMVVSRVKAKKDGEKVAGKEGHIEVIFVDQLGAQPRAISRVVMSRNTAEGLQKILSNNVEKLDAELKSKKMPQQKKPEKSEASKNDKGYLG